MKLLLIKKWGTLATPYNREKNVQNYFDKTPIHSSPTSLLAFCCTEKKNIASQRM